MQHPREIARPTLPSLRPPTAEDGAEIWELIQSCKPLDENSMYCNMLQADHFADTCVVAELKGEIVGWISAYVMPNDPDTLFVWQVAVSEKARGMGLGGLMLQDITDRPVCDDVMRVQTTITSDNAASWGLFRKFGKSQNTVLEVQPYYTQTLHFQNQHKTENLVTIKLARRLARAA